MYRKALEMMRQCVRQGLCKPSSHGFDEIIDDDLFFEDVERAILNGRITERQWDSYHQEFKYVVHGRAISGDEIEVVAKIEPTGVTIIITVYRT